MKREILFRGIKTETKSEWIEGYLLSDREKQSFYICEGIGSSGVEVYDHTISQFTGLLDKNGVKIFEGDVLRFQTFGFELETFETTIQFTKGGFNLENGRPMFYFGQKDFSKMYDAKIIGNIHD